MESQCRFCEIAKHDFVESYNQPVFESDDFFSIVTVGAMIKGWHLIVPKKHTCSMKEVYPSSSFVSYIDSELKWLWNDSKSIIAFEHGPNRFGSNTACGTNHAHLHLVPNCDSLLELMQGDGFIWQKCKPNEISEIAGDKEYLFYLELHKDTEWQNSIGYISVLESEVSQYFRRLVAKTLGNPDEFDYKQYLNLDRVHESVVYLQKLFSTIYS